MGEFPIAPTGARHRMIFSAPDKQVRYTLAHQCPVESPQFLREMGVMLGPAILPGNRVVALRNGAEIFPAMLEAIRSARTTITFETYIYWSGEIGRVFAEALSERARAGVRVHMLIDWVGSAKMDQALLERMEAAGVHLVRYRPLNWYNFGRMNNRTHRKLLVVDGRLGFTGGVGIADPWEGDAQDPEHWRDMHFRVEGPVVAQMQTAFNDNWIKTTGQVLNGEDFFPELHPLGDTHAHLFVASPAGGAESMHIMYLMAIAAAEHSIDLQAAYFVPDPLAVEAIVAARARGVRVRITVPGEHIDSKVVRIASRAAWGELLLAGVEIHEYRPTMFHNKMLIVDRALVSVGSTNFDMRSFRLNDEANLNLYDTAFAEAMTAVYEADLERTRAYTHDAWRRRPLRQKFMEKVVRPFKSQL
ncbi:cardiolipin synthase B [Lysobacter aestuarii]|uniref:Cardiolipin synthase B n=2 Tax=Marilutibacter aestuarii TaxID=1706195 RepID=A0A507ZUT8_9GAMM|nr:phospholipase D-like domain-containing protein [Lysobacter aestuarii]TQD40361.1 cardiolipin synthase B [Lysobacter aestuarii]